MLTCHADQINASWACENDRTLNQILKGEVGFQGYVQSDWGAHHSTLAAVNGLDVSIDSAHVLGIWLTRGCRCLCPVISTSALGPPGGART